MTTLTQQVARITAVVLSGLLITGCLVHDATDPGDVEIPEAPRQLDVHGGGDVSALLSIDTTHTISKVRTAVRQKASYVVASTYEGTLLGVGYDGVKLWENRLSGFMNHDLWCADLTGDGADNVLAANADGTVYCLNGNGELLWQFKTNDAPMNAVCVVHDTNNTPYVVCGGFDNSIYYLSAQGALVKAIHSSTYSKEKSWGKDPSKPSPPSYHHTANFLRPLRLSDGREALVVQAVLYANSSRGAAYLFNPLEEKPFKTIKKGSSVGELRVCDVDQDGVDELLWGSSSMIQDAAFTSIDVESGEQRVFEPSVLRRKIDGFGYRVLQPEIVSLGENTCYFVLFGSRIFLVPQSMDAKAVEILTCRYSLNDMWKDPISGRFIFASAQSGGSCIHVLDPGVEGWKVAYEELSPPGKIASILEDSQVARDQLRRFERPAWEREPLPVYLMTESTRSVAELVDDLKANYASPVFLNGVRTMSENWDRSGMANEKYRNKRDGRQQYKATQQEILDRIIPEYEGEPGIAYWGGHGNDPYMVNPETTKKVVSAAEGKKTVLIYPELEDHSDDFNFCMDDLIVPLARHCQGKNANLYIRTKHVFWQGSIHRPVWLPLLSGQFANVFVPSMEETTDKTMELSIAGRLGIWVSGAVNQWGSRCARDNASYNRLREHSHQMLPNHFLRTMIYHISSGAQYINNFPVDQEYMSFLWELIATGALYVPERSEIVSFSPVHLSMKEPDHHYLNDGSNVKWTTFYDKEFEDNNPFVFSRLNGTWPGAPVTEWDFSRYAAGVEERRLNFLPPYENGLVLITPPQSGVFAAKDLPRGAMKDHLHPLYGGILKEYVTDGRHYYSGDGKREYAADEYFKTIEGDIRDRAKLLPLTVSGNVAWVAAQTSPTHLRLTLIDSGYINPNARVAKVRFHAVKPAGMRDLLSQETFDISDPSSVRVKIPCGMFRFLDVELRKEL
jgi:lambda-carrageenase